MSAITTYEPTEEDIRHIREWLIQTPHLIDDYDDNILRTMIRGSKGRLQKTKDSFEIFSSLGFTYPHMFGHLDPLNEITQYYLNNVYAFPMSEKTQDGCIVCIVASKPDDIDSRFSILELARYIVMSYIVLLWEDELGASKFIFVYDSQNTRLSKLKTVTPTFLKDCVSLGLGFPIRVKIFHFINMAYFLNKILAFVKFWLPKKYNDRLHFHSSANGLEKMVPKKLLPKEFGGDGGDLETLHSSWKAKVESYRDRFISENNKMRNLDHLRPKPIRKYFLGSWMRTK